MKASQIRPNICLFSANYFPFAIIVEDLNMIACITPNDTKQATKTVYKVKKNLVKLSPPIAMHVSVQICQSKAVFS